MDGNQHFVSERCERQSKESGSLRTSGTCGCGCTVDCVCSVYAMYIHIYVCTYVDTCYNLDRFPVCVFTNHSVSSHTIDFSQVAHVGVGIWYTVCVGYTQCTYIISTHVCVYLHSIFWIASLSVCSQTSLHGVCTLYITVLYNLCMCMQIHIQNMYTQAFDHLRNISPSAAFTFHEQLFIIDGFA